ncbi:hypothetical protein EBR25_03265 [bacterium]|nr:hypothetical protein [bacterium]
MPLEVLWLIFSYLRNINRRFRELGNPFSLFSAFITLFRSIIAGTPDMSLGRNGSAYSDFYSGVT